MVGAQAPPPFIINHIGASLWIPSYGTRIFPLSITSASRARETERDREDASPLLIELALLAADKGKGRERQERREEKTSRKKKAHQPLFWQLGHRGAPSSLVYSPARNGQ